MAKQVSNAPAIGSTVRFTSTVSVAPKPGSSKRRSRGAAAGTLTVARRSVVATLPDENGRASLVQDDLAPVPLAAGGGVFLVAPAFDGVGAGVEEECDAAVSDLTPLLEFERGDHADHAKEVTVSTRDLDALVNRYKGYGDQLLRLNDYTCAISYYEAALRFVSTKFGRIGGTLVVNKKGHSVIAEVDCVEDDEKNNPQYDVTFMSGEEETITQKQILLAVWTKDVTFIQPRILLNLSRCLLKLADVDEGGHQHQERYRSAAVRGASIAMSLCEYHALESSDETTRELDSLVEKARMVRSRAFLGLRKLPNATVDARKVLARNPTNREAQSLLADIKAVDAHIKSVDRKLSKEVCRWVQTATSSSNGSDAMGRTDDSVSECRAEDVEPTIESAGTIRKDETGVTARTNETMIDAWRMARNLSMEICGMFAFVVAMWVLYHPSVEQKST